MKVGQAEVCKIIYSEVKSNKVYDNLEVVLAQLVDVDLCLGVFGHESFILSNIYSVLYHTKQGVPWYRFLRWNHFTVLSFQLTAFCLLSQLTVNALFVVLILSCRKPSILKGSTILKRYLNPICDGCRLPLSGCQWRTFLFPLWKCH